MKRRKGTRIAGFIVVLVVLAAVAMVFYRENAKSVIEAYMSRQGIKQSQLEYADFGRDFKRGGYVFNVHIKGEKPDIYYEYSFRDNKVYFRAYQNNPVYIKEKEWGGNGLSGDEMEKLKYPPPK
ncbi:DUF3139 domain-containing protein [Camelliibacillus cellulosilyticus]|uniref:DUF3139 domain-containing protein n=1 Tax=Camelliibacillus cellulosilyticus TaxID=2174486 RepID=A0ABV9GSV3_9BACL